MSCPDCNDPNCQGCKPEEYHNDNPISKATIGPKTHTNCHGCGQLKDCNAVTMPNGDKFNLCDECLGEAQEEERIADETKGEGKVEIEEIWQPTEEDQKKLREGIRWETAFKNLMRKDITDETAVIAVKHFKELVGEDAFVEELFKYPDLAGQIGAKIFKKTVRYH